MATRRATLSDRWSTVSDRPRFQASTYRPVHDAIPARLGDPAPDELADLLTDSGFDVVAQQRVPRIGLIPWPVLTDASRR